MRHGEVNRKTAETDISLRLELDGTGEAAIQTGVGFFDHMLTHVARHGLFNLVVQAKGDLEIDPHHTVEDVGICLGQAFRKALDGAEGVTRFGHAATPMDEVLAEAAVDISGRPFLVFDADLRSGKVGAFDAELTEEFFRAFAMNSRVTLHLGLRRAGNQHHCIEGLFKAFARALRQAVTLDPRVEGTPSTKGTLEI